MKSNYKRLGDYIREVKVRNTAQKAERLLGINIDKFFMPSVANIVGTDMSVYKIVRKNQFACNRMHVGRDYRLPVSMSKTDEEFMVSPAYDVFEIIDKKLLYPEYLMMWFSRREFDRNAWFYTDADVRGGLHWKALCDMQLPIPHPDKQKEIVKEYNIIQKRITLNQRLIQKLEKTAQAIYKQWFVDFEFPDDNGKPYKSSSGEFIESELGDIPTGWEVKKISSFCQITSSKRIFESEYKKEGVPFYRAGEVKQKKEGVAIKDLLYISEAKFLEISKSFGHPLPGDILLTAVGSLLGDSYLVEDETFYFKDGNVVWFRKFEIEGCNLYLYEYLQSDSFKELLDEIKIGSGQSAITIQSLNEKQIVKPHNEILKVYQKIAQPVNASISQFKKQNEKLYELRDLLLSKLATIEN